MTGATIKAILRYVSLALVTFGFTGEVCAQYTSNKGRDFWIGYTDHIDGANSNMQLYLTSEVNTEGIISIPGQNYTQSFSITANSITQVTIPSNKAYVGTTETVEDKAIHVVSNDDIIVYSHIYSNARSEATMVLPTPALGREYYAMTFEQRSQGNHRRSQFMVIAIEDDTEVEITPSQNTLGNHTKGVPFSVYLDSGECYQVQATADLTGSKILSVSTSQGVCKKIAVFSGSGFTSLGCATAGTGDNLYEQLYPVSSWGKSFVTAPLKSRSGDWYRVLISENSTSLTVNGSTGSYNAGDVFDFQGTTANYIVANKPICVAQFARTQGCDNNTGDPFMVIIPPAEQGLDDITLYSSPNQNITGQYINVVMPTAKRNSFKLDNNTVSGWTVVPANTQYSYVQITVQSGNHHLEADTEFVAQAYGFGTVESYGYVAGSNAKNLIQNISLSSDTVCKGKPVRFAGFAAYVPQSWLWRFGDGDTSNLANPSHNYLDTGVYTVTLVTTKNNGNDCSSKDSTSFELRVSESPNANFVFDAGCSNAPVNFQDSSQGTQLDPVFKWEWKINDTTYLYGKSPNFTYEDGGDYTVTLVAFNKSYCSDTITKIVSLIHSPLTKFNDNDICFKDTAKFIDQTTINGGYNLLGRKWDLGSGITSTAPSISYFYQAPGIYDVKLIEYGSSGCNDTLISKIRKYPELKANFNALAVCSPDTVTFIDQSLPDTGGIIKWVWDFGDGNTLTVNRDSVFTVKHYYANYGVYNASLTVYNEINCENTFTRPVSVNHIPKADFNIKNNCQNQDVQFTNNSKINGNQIAGYKWSFGDTKTSTDINPTNIYSAHGDYEITLVAISDKGCTDTIKKPLRVEATPKVNFSIDTVCFGNDAVFSNLTNIDNGTVNSWTWNFGDGNGSSDQNPTHRYNDTLPHNVILTAESDKGCKALLKQSYRVNQLPIIKFDAPNTCLNETAEFSNQSFINRGLIVNFEWNLDDGVITDVSDPMLLYSLPGDKNITLTATSDKGCVTSASKVMKIHPTPDLGFRADNVCIGNETEFVNRSTILTGVILYYGWDFGDGNNSNYKTPDHTYTAPGTYTVTMSGISDMNCKDTIKQNVLVSPYPKAVMDVSPQSGCNPTFANFDGSNSSIDTGNIVEWNWRIGSFADTSAQNFTKLITSAGNHTVILKVVSEKGCSDYDTIINAITVYQTPKADFVSDPDSVSSLNPKVQFNNRSLNASSYIWNFGDGTTSTDPNPQHTFSDEGSYNVSLTVTDSRGCTGTTYKHFVVYPDYTIFIPEIFSPNGDNLNDVFKPVGIFSGVTKYEMTVYTRWGEIVFHTTDINEGWNGLSDNTGEPAPLGGYLYLIILEGHDKSKEKLSGIIYIIR